jgi:hypothetical protein
MPFGPDPRDTQNAIIGDPGARPVAPEVPEGPEPSALSTMTAGLRQTNIVSAAYERVTTPDPDLPDAPEGWDAADNLQGFEAHAWDLVSARTPSELEGRKQRILSEDADRETLRRAGWSGTGAQVVGSILDPTFMLSLAVPESLLAKGILATRAKAAAAHGIAGAALSEIGLQSMQESRTAGESALNVGAAGLLSGVLGHVISRVPGSELAAVRDVIDTEFRQASTVGAASSRPNLTLEQSTIARGGETLSKAISKTPLIRTDLDVLMNAESVEGREALAEIADIAQMTNANAQGISSPVSAENAVSRHEGRVANFIDSSKQDWVTYTQRVPKGEATRMDETTFFTAIARAARNGDTSGIPEVDKAARTLRSEVFQPLWDDAISLGLYDDPVKAAQKRATDKAVDKYVRVETRQQYANYSAGKNVANDRTGFMRKLDEELENPKTPALQAIKDVQTQLDDVAERARQGLSTIDHTVEIGESRTRELIDTATKKFEQDMAALSATKTGTTGGFDIGKKLLPIVKARSELRTAIRAVTQVRREALRTAATMKARTDASVAAAEKIKALREEFKAAVEAPRQALREAKAKARVAARARAEGADKATVNATRKAARKQIKLARQFERQLAQAREAGKAEARSAAAMAKDIRTQAAKERKELRGTVSSLREREYEKFAGPNRPLTRRRFGKEAAKGESKDPHVQAVTKLLREKDSGQLAGRVTVPKVDPRYINKLMNDKSYFTRMYDRERIRANRAEWDSRLGKWFSRSSDADPEEIRAAVDDATDKIMGNDVGLANFATRISTPKAGPLNDRTLDIPSDMIEEFLVNDPTKVARAYTRELAPQVELAKRGLDDEGFKQVLQNITDKYNIMKAEATDKLSGKALNKRIDALKTEQTKVQEALIRVRYRVLGKAGLMSPTASVNERRAVMAARGWRNWVAATRLGGTAATGGLMDLAKITAQYGFAPTMAKLTKLAVSPEFRAYAKKEGRRAGSVIEVALAKRISAVYEGAMTEGWTDKMAHGLYKYTGLNHIMDFNRTLNAVMFEDTMLKYAAKVAKGGKLPQYTRARLASLGLGDAEMKEIAEEVAANGGKLDGVRVSGSALWKNKELADRYDAAILKDSHITIQQPGAADRVWWMDSETGKFIGQLKSFALSAPTRLTAGGAQMAGQGAYGASARFFGFMLMGGYLTHTLRQVVAGRKPKTEPGAAFNEAITESGMLGILPDIVSPPLRLFGPKLGLETSARYTDRNVFASYGGPALGAAQDVYTAATNSADGGVSAKDVHAMRRLVPWQNHFLFRRAINGLEGELSEALDLKDSTQQSLTDRVTETTE